MAAAGQPPFPAARRDVRRRVSRRRAASAVDVDERASRTRRAPAPTAMPRQGRGGDIRRTAARHRRHGSSRRRGCDQAVTSRSGGARAIRRRVGSAANASVEVAQIATSATEDGVVDRASATNQLSGGAAAEHEARPHPLCELATARGRRCVRRSRTGPGSASLLPASKPVPAPGPQRGRVDVDEAVSGGKLAAGTQGWAGLAIRIASRMSPLSRDAVHRIEAFDTPHAEVSVTSSSDIETPRGSVAAVAIRRTSPRTRPSALQPRAEGWFGLTGPVNARRSANPRRGRGMVPRMPRPGAWWELTPARRSLVEKRRRWRRLGAIAASPGFDLTYDGTHLTTSCAIVPLASS